MPIPYDLTTWILWKAKYQTYSYLEYTKASKGNKEKFISLILLMIKRQQATNPNSKRYHRYTKRLEMKSDVPFITVFGRLTNLDKMLSGWWTIEEIYTMPVCWKFSKYKKPQKWKLNILWEKIGTIPYKLMISRQNRMDEMIKAWRTIEELVTVPSSTKLVHNKNSKKLHWQQYPELWEMWNKLHHPSVHRELARMRYYDWWTMIDACNRPKWSRPLTYNK